MMENTQVNARQANATYANSSVVKEAAYRIFAAVANAILVILGGGLLVQTIGNLSGLHVLTLVGAEAQVLLAPAIGVAVASQMNTNTLVTFASMISATVGANAVHFTREQQLLVRLQLPQLVHQYLQLVSLFPLF